MDNQGMVASREMTALERLAQNPDKNPEGPGLGSSPYPPPPQQEAPLVARIAELTIKLNSVEIEHAKAIKDLHDRIVRLERLIDG